MPNSKQIVYLSQAQYAELIANGTITVDGVTVTYNENDIYVTPQAEPVTDVRVNGTSIASNGVANVPVANDSTLGVMKVSDYNGVTVRTSDNQLLISRATALDIKNSNQAYKPITPTTQNAAVFYGLAKAAGHDEKNSTETVGTYTPEAKGAIQSMLGVSDLIATAENSLVASRAYAIGDVFTANGKLYKATAAIAVNDTIVLQNSGETISGSNAEEIKLSDYAVHDVQVNGSSVLSSGVANVPVASTNAFGAIKIGSDVDYSGLQRDANGYLKTAYSNSARVKAGTNYYRPLVPLIQHEAAFYGLAKAAGDTTQSASSNAVGTYTDNAKASIKSMLGIVDGSTGTVSVSGTTPAITAIENTRYVCGEVSTLSFTPPASGISIVRFTSGTTAAVLTLPSTVKFPEWFDATSLEADTIYEICITDGIYGAVMSWAL